jgi:hypothetical protein
MNYLICGKVVELIGTVLLAYVGLNVSVAEVRIMRHLHRNPNLDEIGGTRDNSATGNVKEGMKKLMALRKARFGLTEAIAVGAGTVLIAFGCLIYLIGLMNEHSVSP